MNKICLKNILKILGVLAWIACKIIDFAMGIELVGTDINCGLKPITRTDSRPNYCQYCKAKDIGMRYTPRLYRVQALSWRHAVSLFCCMSTDFSHVPQIKVVDQFRDLVNTRFQGIHNALCWKRDLTGDFQEIVEKLTLEDDITEVSSDDLLALNLSEQGQIARSAILQDMQWLTESGAQPALNLLKCYERDESMDFISTDVYSFHVDRSPIETDTFLCTYFGATSDLIANDQVEQKILIPEIRAKLRELYDGPEAGFEAFLTEYFFDLHYQPKPNAQPISLGLGYLWRLAVDHPNQQVLPCVHRAPVENDGEYRLLLIC